MSDLQDCTPHGYTFIVIAPRNLVAVSSSPAESLFFWGFFQALFALASLLSTVMYSIYTMYMYVQYAKYWNCNHVTYTEMR